MKFVWNGKNKIFKFCLYAIFLLSIGGCGDEEPQKPGDGFYTYPGYRDWYRVPLKFPYQLMMVDDLDRAYLEKYDPSKVLTESGATKTLCQELTHIRSGNNFIIFRRDVNLGGGEALGMLIYESEKIQYFKNEKELSDFMKQYYPNVQLPQWESTEEYYNRMWKIYL